MASKNNSNSNKTAHVMNLLRKNNVPATEENVTVENNAENVQTSSVEVPQTQQQTKTENVQNVQQKPHVIASLNADTEISLNIRDALSDALEDEEKEENEAILNSQKTEISDDFISEIEPVEMGEINKEETLNSENVVDEEIPNIENVAQAETVNVENTNTDNIEEKSDEINAEKKENVQAVVEQQPEKTANTDEIKVVNEKTSDEPTLINMMQLLVEEKVDKYMKMVGVCNCDICRNDVIAIAMNKLSAKYVVMKPSEMKIRSDMYKNRYSGEIIAQLLCACDKVKENPRH